MSDAEGEAGETQVWLEFAVACEHIDRGPARQLYATYNEVIRTLVGMMNHPETWVIGPPVKSR
jgi:four helix bundle protein